MRRIALLLLGLCLTINTVGCKEDETPAPAPAPAPADTPPADDATPAN